jgi:Dyp-type peroxidase family
MDQRPVSASEHTPSKWRLAPPHNANVQGLVASGFSDLPAARAMFLHFDIGLGEKEDGGRWLHELHAVAPIVDASDRHSRAAVIGFTWRGLREMGLPTEALESFDRPFKEGMFHEDRLRRLGDRRAGKWMPTVIKDGPKWSGNVLPDDSEASIRASKNAQPRTNVTTPISVHALLLLYDKDEASVASWATDVGTALEPYGVRIVHQLSLSLRLDQNTIAREHFGFADGVSQPIPYEEGVVKLESGENATNDDSIHRVPLGEILMGHVNGHSEVAEGPALSDTHIGREAGLQPHPRSVGSLDLGRDGSYMVVRELKQYVAQFWQSMERSAARLNASAAKDAAPLDPDWVASKIVGRDRNGNLLRPNGVSPPNEPRPAGNEFRFFDDDRLGRGCPLGSHVRRGNPRDGLAPTANEKQTLLDAANNHRILRRGRKFGPDIDDRTVDDGVDRGLLFICLNTDIGRQFEFVQQTWVLNSNFTVLFNETDPLIGPPGDMTIPEAPLRRIIPVETFVQMAGGEYFFLPSMAALRYLERL